MIKNVLALLTKFYLFWVLFFTGNRIIFLALYRDQWQDFAGGEVFESLYAGLRLDMSTISYFGISFIVLFLFHKLLSIVLKKSWSGEKLFLGFNLVLLVISAFINAGEAGLYSEWGAKLNAKALSHMLDPSEVLGTASSYHILLFLVISSFQILFFLWLLKKYFIHKSFFQKPFKTSHQIIGLTLMLLPMLYFLRGGVQPIPINISDANYSSHVILNDVAINSDWNLIHSIRENKLNLTENPYQFMSDEEAKNRLNKLIPTPSQSYTKLLDKENANIVMLIMESWSADLIEGLGGMKGITPFFDEISDEGYLFTNFYSNGWTSDQGICALLSASPVFPHGSVINQSDKSRKVSSLGLELKKKRNYNSSFHFGGQMSYGNIKAYLINQQFDLLKEQKDLPEIPAGRLGIHDEYMYKVFSEDLNKMTPPFFSAIFTVSTHSPYDIPREMSLDYTGEHEDYLKSAKYADACMKEFMESVKKEDWYDNTLFVVVADHSHKTPIGHHGKNAPGDHKIPLLFYGPALNDSLIGMENNTLGSQIDLLGTLMSGLDMDSKTFHWTKNLMEPNLKSFAPYVFHYGIGMLNEQGQYSYMQDRKVERTSSGATPEDKESIKLDCEAYFQIANEEFIGL
ncbi:MAG: phosphoglycerol transferase MdoB-like AlkP superfamily enzyme [Patiriisocius sp.]|jgi:phosphoglycerol transferase MdoB-like AlkP superfamily enzyme